MRIFDRVDHVSRGARAAAQQIASDMRVLGLTPTDGLQSENVSWQDVFAAEAAFLKQLPPPHLLRRATDVYDRYEDAIPEVRRKGFERVKDVVETDEKKIEALRADVLRVHAVTARELLLNQEVEGERSRLSTVVAMTGATALAGIAVFLLGGRATVWGVITWILFITVLLYTASLWVRGLWANRRTGAMLGKGGGAILLAMCISGFPGSISAQTTGTSTTTATETVAASTQTSGTAPTTDAPTTTTGKSQTGTTGTGATGTGTTGTTKTTGTMPVTDTSGATDTARNTAPCEECGREEEESSGKKQCRDAGPTLVAAALMGVLGATFSILQRIQRGTKDHDPLVVLLTFRAAWTQLPLSLLSGAIAAMILYGIFAARMLEGTLFPKIVNCCATKENWAMPLKHFFDFTGPASAADHARLLVWAVIAGFAERFVPDILDRFATPKK